MNTVNGNFIEKSIPDNSDATITVKIGNTDSTMNLVDFQTAITPAPAYKVYTALLTQSGGDITTFINGDEPVPLTIGVTYQIADNTGLDVTNVGSPNNNIGTYFIATGTTPNSWGNIIDGWGIITYNTGAPVVTVLENTIGNVWFTYSGVGNYLLNSNGLFTVNKTVTQMLPEQYTEEPAAIYNYQSLPGSINVIAISSLFNYIPEDSWIGTFAQNAIEIRVYN